MSNRSGGYRLYRPATAAALAIVIAHGVGATETGTGTEAPPGNARHVCAYYDSEHATYTGTVAVLEPAGDIGTDTAEGRAYRLLVLAVHEGAPHAPQAPALTGDRALALLGNAEAALREGRATREAYTGHAMRDRNRLRFTSAEEGRLPRTMLVFTAAGLAVVEGPAGRRDAPGDGPYRCAPPLPAGDHPQLPVHCAEARSGPVDLEGFPSPKAEVALIQSALDKAGMAPGPIDGIFGQRTLGALVRWAADTRRAQERIITYEIICPLIGTLGAERTPRE
ncbi:MAG: hypothetical protein OXI15_04860 [Chromatiales bacterium]|nr:hypothetical protein [Chromatiales bacterium]